MPLLLQQIRLGEAPSTKKDCDETKAGNSYDKDWHGFCVRNKQMEVTAHKTEETPSFSMSDCGPNLNGSPDKKTT